MLSPSDALRPRPLPPLRRRPAAPRNQGPLHRHLQDLLQRPNVSFFLTLPKQGEGIFRYFCITSVVHPIFQELYSSVFE